MWDIWEFDAPWRRRYGRPAVTPDEQRRCDEIAKDAQKILESLSEHINTSNLKVVSEVRSDRYVIRLPLPGVKRDRVHVKLTGRTLDINVSKNEGDEATLYDGEMKFNAVIPKGHDLDSAVTTLEDGLLSVWFSTRNDSPVERNLTIK
jgi:HSP20 family molecular chaperone IbpA